MANQGDGSVTALLGNGDGTFQSQIAVGGASGPIALCTGDFNGEGKPNLVATTINGQIVCFQNGGGTFIQLRGDWNVSQDSRCKPLEVIL